MDGPKLFLEAVFWIDGGQPETDWKDQSTDDFFIFSSGMGTVRLRKRHVFPRTFVTLDSAQLIFGYGDPKVGTAIATKALRSVPEDVFYREEFLWVSADSNTGNVVVQRDAFCTLPCFMATHDNRLVLANRLERIYSLLNTEALRPCSGLIRYLCNQPLQEHTFFHDISLLGERRRLVWQGGKTRVMLPPDSTIVSILEARTGDPRYFRSYLEDTLERYWCAYGQGATTGMLMSTGLDSTMVAGYLADQGHKTFWASVVHPGGVGEVQTAQLQDLQQRFTSDGLLMYPMDVDVDYPLSGMVRSGTWQPFFHNQEVFEAFHRLAFLLAQRGIETLFTGFGGDELCQNDTPENVVRVAYAASEPIYFSVDFRTYAQKLLATYPPASSPLPLIARPLEDTNVNFYNLFIDYNIWPVSPLSDPQLYHFCQGLPDVYRAQKNILRGYQYARQFPPSVYRAPVVEQFAAFFQQAVNTHLRPVLNAFLEHSLLAAQGVVDKQEVDRLLQQCVHDNSKTGLMGTFDVYRLLVTEINLQTLSAKYQIGRIY